MELEWVCLKLGNNLNPLVELFARREVVRCKLFCLEKKSKVECSGEVQSSRNARRGGGVHAARRLNQTPEPDAAIGGVAVGGHWVIAVSGHHHPVMVCGCHRTELRAGRGGLNNQQTSHTVRCERGTVTVSLTVSQSLAKREHSD